MSLSCQSKARHVPVARRENQPASVPERTDLPLLGVRIGTPDVNGSPAFTIHLTKQ